MKIGLIGLGKMGGNMVKRLRRDGHEVVGFASHASSVRAAVADGAIGATNHSRGPQLSRHSPAMRITVRSPGSSTSVSRRSTR